MADDGVSYARVPDSGVAFAVTGVRMLLAGVTGQGTLAALGLAAVVVPSVVVAALELAVTVVAAVRVLLADPGGACGG